MRKLIFNIFVLLTISIWMMACSSVKKSLRSYSSSPTFTPSQTDLVMAGDTAAPMRVFKINNPQDSVLLREKSQPVVIDSKDIVLKTFIKRLYHTVTDSLSMGVGIAAPQVGILKNIIWVQRFDKENYPFEVYLNPKIVQYTKLKQPCLEGCLSIPERRDTTMDRSYAILIEYDRMDNTHVYEMVEDFTAVIFQHEIDHLNGILYIDHLNKEMQEAKGK